MPFGLYSYRVVFDHDQFPIDFAAGDDLDWYLVINDPRAVDWTVVVRDSDGTERRPRPERQGTRLSQSRYIGEGESAWFAGSSVANCEAIVVFNPALHPLARITFEADKVRDR